MHSDARDSPDSPDFWEYVIQPDKSASPKFEQLLLGLARALNRTLEPRSVHGLSPEKLANFYHTVGGNYDALFLKTPHSSLSFIYQSLGCFHSLQPTSDPRAPPSIPSLLPSGFARWQTIQLLLCPEEHIPLMQEAVKQYDITNPMTGQRFPKSIPTEVFPTQPDEVMTKWHDQMLDRLENEAESSFSPTRAFSPASPPEWFGPNNSPRPSISVDPASPSPYNQPPFFRHFPQPSHRRPISAHPPRSKHTSWSPSDAERGAESKHTPSSQPRYRSKPHHPRRSSLPDQLSGFFRHVSSNRSRPRVHHSHTYHTSSSRDRSRSHSRPPSSSSNSTLSDTSPSPKAKSRSRKATRAPAPTPPYSPPNNSYPPEAPSPPLTDDSPTPRRHSHHSMYDYSYGNPTPYGTIPPQPFAFTHLGPSPPPPAPLPPDGYEDYGSKRHRRGTKGLHVRINGDGRSGKMDGVRHVYGGGGAGAGVASSPGSASSGGRKGRRER